MLNHRQLLEVFDTARSCGALVMVHCEGCDAIRFMTEKLERSGPTQPYYHAVSRPQVVEREATHWAISHAELTDVPIVVVHPSGREAIEQFRWAQTRGLRIYDETCPQCVALTADDLKGLNMDETGGKYVAHRHRVTSLVGMLSRKASAPAVPVLFLRPLSVSLGRSEGKTVGKGTDIAPLGAQRHPGDRDASAESAVD